MAKKNVKVYFEGMTTLEEVRMAFVDYVKTIAADSPEFKSMHKAYVTAYNKLRNVHKTVDGKVYERVASLDAAQFEYMLTKVLEYGLEFEVRGSFLWVTGDTKPNRTRLTGLGFGYKWNVQKWMWKEGYGLPKNVDDVPQDAEKTEKPEKKGKGETPKKAKTKKTEQPKDETLIRKVEGKEHDAIMAEFKARAAKKRANAKARKNRTA